MLNSLFDRIVGVSLVIIIMIIIIIIIVESYRVISLQGYFFSSVSYAHVVALSEKNKYHSVWL